MSDTFDAKEAHRGDVHAFDVRTGEELWTFNTIPQEDSSEQRLGKIALGHIQVMLLFGRYSVRMLS